MKASGIGGQAVIEGIMMRHNERYSIAVRKPDNEIELMVKESKPLSDRFKWMKAPVIRGVIAFADSLVTGISTINYSASFYDDPAEQKKTRVDEVGKSIFKDKLESVLMAITVIISVFIAVGLFMVLPYFISQLVSKYISSKFMLNFFEGIVRVLLFVLYIFAISRVSDIKRTFMYHGAEHKCINCIESGARLTPENVKNSSRLHKRCGTSFMFLVMFISVIFFIFIRVDNTALQLVIRILLIPVIAGVSYEVIKWAGKNDNMLVNIISAPGMLMQKLTTKEPDMDMIEVAIKAVEAVFDWEEFLNEYHEEAADKMEAIALAEAKLALAAGFVSDNDEKTRKVSAEASKEIIAEEMQVYNQENFNGRFEEQDGSGDTNIDHIYDYDEQDEEMDDDALTGFIIEDDEEEQINYESPKINYILEEDDTTYEAYNEAATLEMAMQNPEIALVADVAPEENAQREGILSEAHMEQEEYEKIVATVSGEAEATPVIEKVEAEYVREGFVYNEKDYADVDEAEAMEGFEFVDENVEMYADEVPTFKERKKKQK